MAEGIPVNALTSIVAQRLPVLDKDYPKGNADSFIHEEIYGSSDSKPLNDNDLRKLAEFAGVSTHEGWIFKEDRPIEEIRDDLLIVLTDDKPEKFTAISVINVGGKDFVAADLLKQLDGIISPGIKIPGFNQSFDEEVRDFVNKRKDYAKLLMNTISHDFRNPQL